MKVPVVLLVSIFTLTMAKEREDGIKVIDNILNQVPQPIEMMMHFIKNAFPGINLEPADLLAAYNICKNDTKREKELSVCQKRTALTECQQPIGEYFEKHLPENSKDLHQVVSASSRALDEHICNSKVGDLLELLNECIIVSSGLNSQQKIYERGQHFKEQLKILQQTPTKATLCQVVKSFIPIFTDPVKTACQSDVTVKAYTDFLAASIKPCNELSSAAV